MVYSGKWAGNTSDGIFENYTEIIIEAKDGEQKVHTVWMNDRRISSPTKKTIKIENDTFSTTMPNWLMSNDIALTGTFHGDSLLKLNVQNAGMVGLLEYDMELHLVEKTGSEAEEEYKYSPPEDIDGFVNGADSSSVGIPGTKAETLVSAIRTEYSGSHESPEIPRIEGILVIKDGVAILEEYFNGFYKEAKHNTASAMKSVTSILFGILYDQGLANLDDLITDIFDYPNNWKSKKATIRDALAMSAGVECGMNEAQLLLRTDNVPRLLLSLNQVNEPGIKYSYDNSLPCLIACYIELKSGMHFAAFAMRYLFDPLGINVGWTYTRETSVGGGPMVMASGGLHITLRDYSKLAKMMLDDGVFDGKRILSSEYIALSTSHQSPPGDYPYGFFWHLNPKENGRMKGLCGYWALGQGGQFFGIFPKHKTVVAVNSSCWHSGDYEPKILKLLQAYLF
ncbi:unnamed protein product [Kuraishia capsulata CBS 1993]|uniref:Beta-lactamase-related domain-containing protein n=1 Tax=Kuraishia capsulata CBS 1993 TaxID=1382522 RepID=W6MHQ0_9ASCO|nr:uncharacterized protein KUCA_T00001282001 [Kuraishia capsulata CBS 1993]CDK25313.1 unnamed protein product [Kuraishia capsulata CBS 1993]